MEPSGFDDDVVVSSLAVVAVNSSFDVASDVEDEVRKLMLLGSNGFG